MVVPPPRVPLAVAPARPRMTWDAWGTGDAALPAPARALVTALVPGRAHPVPRLDPTALRLSPSRLVEADLAALAVVVGFDHVGVDDERRALHLGGKSTPDLLARRDRGEQRAPDAVIEPAHHDEVATILQIAADRSIAVVPFGGGTSVVGGVAPRAGAHRAVIALDLRRTAALINLDDTSLLATFGAGTTGPQAEDLLRPRGFTLGHFPQSWEYASLGGFAATRSSGQASRGYGRFDDLVHGLRLASPAGTLELGRAPASAAGPDLRQLILGSEGAFGVITEVTVQIRPVPADTRYAAWTFADFAAGTAAVREATQRGIRPTVLRLSDETETRVNAALGGHFSRLRGCLAVATAEGASTAGAERTAADLDGVFVAHGARRRGEDPARSWERGRFAAPALRDRLLDIGVLAETLETATTWSRLDALKRAVTAALDESLRAGGSRPIVLCHISHVYPAGASLYFTVVAASAADPVAQWRRAKDAASRAIVAEQATITHHHAVGRDHAPYLASEIGALGEDVLRAVKRTLDPSAIMNPGVLISAAGEAG